MPRWVEPVIPQLQLEASPAAEEPAPEPALTGASGHPAEPPAGQSRPGPGQDDARRPDHGQARTAAYAAHDNQRALPWARVRAACLAGASPLARERVQADYRSG